MKTLAQGAPHPSRATVLACLLAATGPASLRASSKPCAPAPRTAGAGAGSTAEAARPERPFAFEVIRDMIRRAVLEDPAAYAPELALDFLDLRRRDLGGLVWHNADLRGRDLRGVRLEGLDLTGARLDGANLTGVSLKGTRLFGATHFNAKGLDFTGAQMHPFFTGVEQARPGDLRWLEVEAGAEGKQASPRALASTPDFPLVFVPADGSRWTSLSTTGASHGFSECQKAECRWLVGDARRIWSLGNDGLDLLSLREGADGWSYNQKSFGRQFTSESKGGPLGLRLHPSGDLVVGFAEGTLRFRTKGDRLDRKVYLHPKQFTVTDSLLTRNGKAVVLALADRDELAIMPAPLKAGQSLAYWKLPTGTRCGGLALGADGRIWFTFNGAGKHGIGWLDPAGSRQRHITAPPLPSGVEPRLLGPLEPMPDGRGVWFGDHGGRIGSVVEIDGLPPLFLEVDLPRGVHPQKLVPSNDGRMFFTAEGFARIGAVKLRSIPPGLLAGAAGGAAEAPAETKRPRPSRKRRSEPAGQLESKAREAVPEGAAPSPADASDGDAPAAGAGAAGATPAPGAGAAPGPGTKGDSKGAAPERPRPAAAPRTRLARAQALLRANDVQLPEHKLRHIQETHRFDRNDDKSQFAKHFETPEDFTDLLARGLDDSGAVGRIRCHDLRGGRKTLCREKGVGYYNNGQDWIPTDWFVVVTTLAMDGRTHIIQTAYPAPPDRI